MLSIDFNKDGTVRVYASQNGATLSVSAPANQLPDLLPPSVMITVREKMNEFLALTVPAHTLKNVNHR